MVAYIFRRLLAMIPTIILISIITFIIIQLPPGDFFSTLQASLAETGGGQNTAAFEHLSELYGLNQPLYVQYFRWISGWLRLDFGYSLEWNAPVWAVLHWHPYSATEIDSCQAPRDCLHRAEICRARSLDCQGLVLRGRSKPTVCSGC